MSHEAYQERAAIMEFDGGLSRQEAQRQAARIVFGNKPPKDCPECGKPLASDGGLFATARCGCGFVME